MAGGREVVEVMTVNFSLLAMDQIVNNAAKIRYMFGGERAARWSSACPAAAAASSPHSIRRASTPGSPTCPG